ncbi:C-type lectin domain family 4 member C-like [Polypterus senegalus]|uniref:C-type lectin domain family 4 member C-like n=1 Tax=Polypterus senegalus TaxID=55291 RepID=UPI0019657969|nr:C-type lectin domain family 4 member C-like [Polypterus senegalus]
MESKQSTVSNEDVTYAEVKIVNPLKQQKQQKESQADNTKDVAYAEVTFKKTLNPQHKNPGSQAGIHDLRKSDAESDACSSIDRKVPETDKLSIRDKSTDVLVHRIVKKRKKCLLWWSMFLCAVFVAAIIVFVLYVIETKYKNNEDKLQSKLSVTTEELRLLQHNLTLLKSHLSNLTSVFDKYCSVRSTSAQEWQCAFCPKSWLLFNTKCYYFSTNRLTWKDSRDFCTSMGGHLVIIESEEEQNFLLNKTAKTTDNSYWIGLTDQKIENKFFWVNNESLNENKTFWAKRDDGGTEPDDYKEKGNGQEGEDCVHLFNTTINYGWYDAWCTATKQMICEADTTVIHF